MAAAGAPRSYLAINTVALIVAVAAARWGRRALRANAGQWLGPLAVALLWVPVVVGPDVEGVRRWLSLGPVTLHVAMLVLPLLILRLAATGPATGTALVLATALALALHPDRASALALLAGTVALALQRRRLINMAWCTIAAGGLAATLLRPDPLQPVRFVETIVADAWSIHGVFAIALGLSLLNLVTIGITSLRSMLPVSACLAGLCAAAAFGPYPWPIIGYGAAAILGYGLSIALSRIMEDPE